ncbi:MAG TPA: 23S rRNA (uracil(1939)-C(5))-methyltransferase RlmD [Patescibacteria group bacterium]|nr:23S rRNA (uracil(1939)-C(5))-methyltransferase RlmD [Patescibacteria group bacterium]
MSKRNRKYEAVELEVEAIGFEGVAIARKEGVVHFVKGALPGDVVRAQVMKKKKSYVETKLEDVLKPSEHRVEPLCPYFGTCGGCSWQHLAYTQQLMWKQRHVIDAFERIGKIPYGEILPTAPSPREYYYRNKMEFSFGRYRWLMESEIASGVEFDKNFALGLHVPGFHDKVLDIEQCFIHQPVGNKILNDVKAASKHYGCEAYEYRNHTGFLRNLVIRTSRATGEIMVILVTAPPQSEMEVAFVEWFETEFLKITPEATTVIHAVSHSKSSVAIGEPRLLKGEPFMIEEALGVKYRISPFSFFQTNSYQLEHFLKTILDYADIDENQVVWDLYCGTGSITLPAAKRAKKVYGIEMSESSIRDARVNMELNGITNVEFFCEDLHAKETPALLNTLEKPDVLIIDPPRAGMHKNLAEHLLEIAAPHVVYVSCNPSTQARDCEILHQKYDVVKIQPVDMFPHTFHIESVAVLKLRDNA